jgi:hypothetical protein
VCLALIVATVSEERKLSIAWHLNCPGFCPES